ncbi:MAG: pyroglutamyl-peptidase I [Deltaproteobacteria bacterium]|nr:pyroglutamyl-peptidase I [Deltaproteobacteria bacterium]
MRSAVLVVATCLSACAAAPEAAAPAARASRDSTPDGIFHDFFDGKLDGMGHPVGAFVWQAEDGCDATTGAIEAEGRAARPGAEQAGVLCRASRADVGAGRFVVNVRALALDPIDEAGCDPTGDPALVEDACDPAALSIVVRDAQGAELGREGFTRARLGEALVQRNVSIAFTHAVAGAIDVAVEWPGHVAVRLDYVELFRAQRRLVVSPPSSVASPEAELEIEMLDPPDGAELALRCGDVERTTALTELLASGRATRERTDFREVVRAPLPDVLDGCALPARLAVSMSAGGWTRATSRVTLRAEDPVCAFEEGKTRVLLTGFEPFPADSSSDNSSEQAVLAFDAGSVEGVSVARLVLPVEWDVAAQILVDTVERCRPDVIIGFGQGRSRVDLETTAYNTKDTAEIAGGIPDNRGLVLGGEPIVSGGPAEIATRLPATTIVDALVAAGIDAGTSDDPGRYICNNLFYRLMHAVRETPAVAGFVHLPRLPRISDAERARLRTTVSTVVAHAVGAHRASSSSP